MIINTPYVSGKSTDEVAKSLEEASRLIFQWFSDNQFKGRPYFRKGQHHLREKRAHIFHFQGKKGTLFSFSRGTFFPATLMLMHETRKIGPARTSKQMPCVK